MSPNGFLQIAVFLGVLLLLAKPLGAYMAAVFEGRPTPLTRLLQPVEHILYRVCGVDTMASMTWRGYAAAFLCFNLASFLAVYGILRMQSALPWNSQGFPNVEAHTAFNIAVSFATNTDWQNYGGETTLSYFTQMVALTVQNFVSAASGMAVAAAFARGVAGRRTAKIGNFWADLFRGTSYVLLPLSFVLALALVSQGVVQNMDSYRPTAGDSPAITQLLPMGPAASQVAIKQLGTNGGGFFSANSAHPFENPTPLSNFLEMTSILLIPVAFCYTFGRMIGDVRQGWALMAAMTLLFLPLAFGAIVAEHQPPPALASAGLIGGNMEGKEVRFGIVNSALWAAATTAASNGSVNAMHDSFAPLGGMAALFLMQLSEVVYGGVGSGLYGMVIYAIITVFLAGLMIGRTPEYMGKKIEAFEMKMASIAVLVPPLCVLAGTAIAVVAPLGVSGLQDRGPHGFSEILYAFTSMGNNNGSAFGGYAANTILVNLAGGIAMLASRYWIALPVLAIAGSLAAKKTVPASNGTLATHTPLFIVTLAVVVIVVGALSFIPSLALGPVVEHLRMIAS
ncbi:MAG: potassium-transporting ATPase subunit KdpA [Bryobacterales bacterium]|nr:potassium-transporting ATPase subunit KdpA [Bryobacterales bacterium]